MTDNSLADSGVMNTVQEDVDLLLEGPQFPELQIVLPIEKVNTHPMQKRSKSGIIKRKFFKSQVLLMLATQIKNLFNSLLMTNMLLLHNRLGS